MPHELHGPELLQSEQASGHHGGHEPKVQGTHGICAVHMAHESHESSVSLALVSVPVCAGSWTPWQ